MVLSFHMSNSDIAFVVKFKFNEGGSEIGGGAVPHHGASASLPFPDEAGGLTKHLSLHDSKHVREIFVGPIKLHSAKANISAEDIYWLNVNIYRRGLASLKCKWEKVTTKVADEVR